MLKNNIANGAIHLPSIIKDIPKNQKNQTSLKQIFVQSDKKETLTEEQKEAYKLLKEGKNVFLTGAAGSGKSFLIKHFIKWCKVNNKRVAVTSSTGVSAVLIDGCTLHSWAGIGLGEEDGITLLERVKNYPRAYTRWLKTQILIVDEISMISVGLIEKLNYIGQQIRHDTSPFGNLQLVFVGDFAQLPPCESLPCFTSNIWNDLIEHAIILENNIRQKDPIFREILLEARKGNLSEESIEILKTRVGAKISCPPGIIPTKLYSHRVTVDDMNEKCMRNLVSETNPLVTYEATDKIKSKRGFVSINQEQQYLSKLDKRSKTRKKVQFCIGAQVMLLYNLNVEAGLANGSRGVVIAFENRLPKVRFMNGIENIIDPINLKVKLGEGILGFREQVPLMLAFACTIHKSQGSTLDCVQMDLGQTIFAHGQAYTALSRVKSLDKLSIVTFKPDRIMANPLVKEFYNCIEAGTKYYYNDDF